MGDMSVDQAVEIIQAKSWCGDWEVRHRELALAGQTLLAELSRLRQTPPGPNDLDAIEADLRASEDGNNLDIMDRAVGYIRRLCAETRHLRQEVERLSLVIERCGICRDKLHRPPYESVDAENRRLTAEVERLQRQLADTTQETAQPSRLPCCECGNRSWDFISGTPPDGVNRIRCRDCGRERYTVSAAASAQPEKEKP